MDIRHLQCFIAVAKFRSFSQASVALNISQPAISKTIKNLEKELNLELFFRYKGNIELTIAGYEFKSKAEKLLDDFSKLSSEFKNPSKDSPITLTVGISQGASEFIMKDINKFLSTFPNVNLKIIENSSTAFINMLETDFIDIAVTKLIHTDHLPKSITAVPLFNDYLSVVVPKNNTFADRPFISINDLNDTNLLLPDPEYFYYSKYIYDKYRTLSTYNCVQSSTIEFILSHILLNNKATIMPNIFSYSAFYKDFAFVKLEPEIPITLCILYKYGHLNKDIKSDFINFIHKYDKSN
ncbi:LysR family transcriptional regulator [Clostridium paraputrificum]|uniref:LysR family transcriptional regulator n=1 Tax=Clostridium TaxID=1485 RepID=UPI003D34EB98